MLDSPIEDIKSRINILDLIQDFVPLKKAGTNYKGVCPFHSEKTPSFMVSPSKQIWHCFGCGLGGDIFEFIKQTENVEFAEALKILADRAGVELKKPTAQQVEVGKKKDVLYEINDAAAKYFQRVLWETESGREALAYLRNRGLTDPTIKNWQLGFAPDDYHYLENYLAKSFDKKDIELAGLIIKSDRNTETSSLSSQPYFDRFHDRVMFPIANLHGQVVGFTGRLLHDKPNTGKYVNSPETPIYNKSREIYGLFAAKQQIKKDNRAILVEGNMDVIACHQAGSQNAIATSGTALTDMQLQVVKRFTENLVFAFDGDKAGTIATKRALELALNQGFNVKIVGLGQAKDPDELIKKGIGLWQKAVDTASNFLDFFFDQVFAANRPDTVEGKREITKELAPLIFRISDPITKAHYVRKLASGINVAETAVWDIINKLTAPKPVRQAASERKKSRREILEDRLLGLSINLQDRQFLSEFQPGDFQSGNRELFESLSAGQAGDEALSQLLSFAAEVDVREQNLEPKQELAKTASELTKLVLKEQMQNLAGRIREAEERKDKSGADELSKLYHQLMSRLAKYA